MRILLPCLLLNLRRLLLLGLWPLLLRLRLRLLLGLLLLLGWHLLCILLLLSLHSSLLHTLHLSCLSFRLRSRLRRPLSLLRRRSLLGRGSTCRSSPATELCHDSSTGTDNLRLGLVTRLASFGVVVVHGP